MQWNNKKWHDFAPVVFSLILLAVLLAIPTGFEDHTVYQESYLESAEVLETDDSSLKDTGLVRSGEQRCRIRILSGVFKGREAVGKNLLNGSLEQDKLFVLGDRVLIRINYQDGEILSVSMIDHYRIPQELLLAALFCLVLIVFAGKTGLRALLSFAVSVLMIWKVLVPLFLRGFNPVLIGLAIVLVLTVVIITLVFGFDRRALSAISGCILGIAVTCVLGMLFTDAFRIHGAVMGNSESLLYSGYSDLNLTRIFMASIFIGASGAVMDLSVDISSAVYEVVQKKLDIGWREAMKSGMAVGRAALGTQTTTLLFAYSGGYIAMLMVFMAQGTPLYTAFNLKYVSAEILHTLVGSVGLCTVAPLTAFVSGFVLTHRKVRLEIPQK